MNGSVYNGGSLAVIPQKKEFKMEFINLMPVGLYLDLVGNLEIALEKGDPQAIQLAKYELDSYCEPDLEGETIRVNGETIPAQQYVNDILNWYKNHDIVERSNKMLKRIG